MALSKEIYRGGDTPNNSEVSAPNVITGSGLFTFGVLYHTYRSVYSIIHRISSRVPVAYALFADIKPDNIMVQFEDPTLPHRSALEARVHLLSRKQCDYGRIIYRSGNDFRKFVKGAGFIQLSDFDCAVRGDVENNGSI